MELLERPLANGDTALLLLNRDEMKSGKPRGPRNISLYFSDLGDGQTASFVVRDMWARKDLGLYHCCFTTPAALPSHGVQFLRLTPAPTPRHLCDALIDKVSWQSWRCLANASTADSARAGAHTKTDDTVPSPASRPHIVFFMVDDWGWADVGYHRKDQGPADQREIQTPHIDALVSEGVELDRHCKSDTTFAYTFPVDHGGIVRPSDAYQWCTPTRSSFLSGRLPVHINYITGHVCNAAEGIPREMTSIAAQLKKAGYAAHQLGKWSDPTSPTHTQHFTLLMRIA